MTKECQIQIIIQFCATYRFQESLKPTCFPIPILVFYFSDKNKILSLCLWQSQPPLLSSGPDKGAWNKGKQPYAQTKILIRPQEWNVLLSWFLNCFFSKNVWRYPVRIVLRFRRAGTGLFDFHRSDRSRDNQRRPLLRCLRRTLLFFRKSRRERKICFCLKSLQSAWI